VGQYADTAGTHGFVYRLKRDNRGHEDRNDNDWDDHDRDDHDRD
jgi:hypothetical protein